MSIVSTLIEKVWQVFESSKFNLGITLVSKHFKYITIYSENDEDIIGLLFTNSKKYSDYCADFEHKLPKKGKFYKGSK